MWFGKKILTQNATVIQDCTGSYLHLHNKDYKVCNAGKVAAIANGTSVTATFKISGSCPPSDNVVVSCYLYHAYESRIEIEHIR